MHFKKLKQIIQILSDGEFHSGADLGKKLKITRSAVWKLIGQLKALDLKIEAKSNLGYKLPLSLSLLTAKEIKKYLNPKYHPYLNKTIIFDQISSTNTYLREKLGTQKQEFCICLAEYQDEGRSRLGRPLPSPFAQNIYLSLLWNFSFDFRELTGLNLVVALAIIKALERMGVSDLSLRWPSDVLWRGRKIGGSLIELSGESHYNCSAVIGVCVFVMSNHLASEQNKGFLSEVLSDLPDRNKVVALLIEELLKSLTRYQEEKFTAFISEVQKLDLTLNQKITVQSSGRKVQGRSRGINESGFLLLEKENKDKILISNGEIV